jgi:hypothetical protein
MGASSHGAWDRDPEDRKSDSVSDCDEVKVLRVERAASSCKDDDDDDANDPHDEVLASPFT